MGGGGVETGVIRQTVRLDASPAIVYALLVDPERHTAFTDAPATGEPVVNGAFTAWAEYIVGRHLVLEPGRLIVQEWRTSEWPEGAPPSRLEIVLAADGEGCILTMVHGDVPASQIDDYAQGWEDFYWAPMRAYLAQRT
ncbi:MAG: hypothetical protein EPO26_05200 [Chloroflexota bacterium]|nr:MAG: hypothetical protein EPO26_05200 [Chloroflexota bacterium]